jgi:LmbE family N-acetylglucosaminyl deacetylase
MATHPLRLLAIGAHPDDAEYKAGGLAALYRRQGHEVKLMALTHGSSGHHKMMGPELAHRRRAECETAAGIIGAIWEVWDQPDGQLEASIPLRFRMIRAIREFKPDLVLTHRTFDYHPDHRAAGQLVQDAAYLVTMPAICPEVPAMRKMPVIGYFSDEFHQPYPFRPDVVVDIAEVWDAKISLLDAHESQFYEWLPYNQGLHVDVPEGELPRRSWLSGRMEQLSRRVADRYRERLVSLYGPSFGRIVHLVESFEISEYGTPLDTDKMSRFFPTLMPKLPH